MHKRQSLIVGRRLLAVGFGVLGAIGCAGPQTKSPQNDSLLTESKVELAEFTVVDKRGRFKANILAAEPIELSDQPGYVQLTISVGLSQEINCFVYETPIDAGVSVHRLLQSVGTGATLSGFVPPELSLVGQYPVLSMSVDYKSNLPPEESGTFFAKVSPRDVFPVVCTYDGTEKPAVAEKSMQSVLRSLSPNLPSDTAALAEEIWSIREGQERSGFSITRVLADGEAGRVTYSRSAMFSQQLENFVAQDSLSVEQEKGERLVQGKWLHMNNGNVMLRAQLAWEPEIGRYHYGALSKMDSTTGYFDDVPLKSSGRPLLEFESLMPSAEWLRYVPSLFPQGPTKASYQKNDIGVAMTLSTFAGTSTSNAGSESAQTSASGETNAADASAVPAVCLQLILGKDGAPARFYSTSPCGGHSQSNTSQVQAELVLRQLAPQVSVARSPALSPPAEQ